MNVEGPVPVEFAKLMLLLFFSIHYLHDSRTSDCDDEFSEEETFSQTSETSVLKFKS